jgi:hypothetical protein
MGECRDVILAAMWNETCQMSGVFVFSLKGWDNAAQGKPWGNSMPMTHEQARTRQQTDGKENQCSRFTL